MRDECNARYSGIQCFGCWRCRTERMLREAVQAEGAEAQQHTARLYRGFGYCTEGVLALSEGLRLGAAQAAGEVS